MISWPEEILGAFAEFIEVFTRSEFKAAMTSKPGSAGLSFCVQREKGDPASAGYKEQVVTASLPASFLGLSPRLWKVVWPHSLPQTILLFEALPQTP